MEISAEYLDHMGSDLTVVNAARASFGKAKEALDEEDVRLIRFLASGYSRDAWKTLREAVKTAALTGSDEDLDTVLRCHARKPIHWSPFAHPQVQIRTTVPVLLARQLVKHQVGGVWSEESRRYISDDPTFWKPSSWLGRPANVKQGAAGVISAQEVADFAADTGQAFSAMRYRELLSLGVAPEEARCVLPLGHMTTVVWTGSLAFWARAYNQRHDLAAQTVARQFAGMLADIVKPLFPVSWEALCE